VATTDKCVSIYPFFVVKDGQMENVKKTLPQFVKKTKSEDACLYYGFSVCGNKLHCREAYRNGEGVLAHLENVGSMLQELLESGMVELAELQLHGPEEELAKLREPLANLNPEYWVLEHGFRR
jgi:quinol monooxygenase YgiN